MYLVRLTTMCDTCMYTHLYDLNGLERLYVACTVVTD